MCFVYYSGMLDLTSECSFNSVIKKRSEIKSMEAGVQSNRFFMLHKTTWTFIIKWPYRTEATEIGSPKKHPLDCTDNLNKSNLHIYSQCSLFVDSGFMNLPTY